MKQGMMIFFQPVKFTTTPDDQTLCEPCGALVRDQQAHRRWHEAMAMLAREANQASSDASSARSMARRGGW